MQHNLTFFVVALVALTLTALSAFAQHRYYVRTVRRLAAEHHEAGSVLVSGRGKSRFRGAIVVLVLRTEDERIRAAAVMEGSTVFARFRDRTDWVGLSARDPLPGCSPRAAAAVADARTRIPGRGKPVAVPRSRFAVPGTRPVGGRSGAERRRSGSTPTAR